MKTLRLWTFLSLCLLLSACIGMGSKLEAPRLSLVGASLTSADIFSQQFRVRLHVQNPNARSLPIKGIDYKLSLEGDGFAEGVTDASFVVPAHGEKEFDLLVRTNFMSSIGRLMSRLNNSNTLRYDFSGKITVGLPFSPKLVFQESGTVDLSRR